VGDAWSVAGKAHSLTFRTKELADRYRSRLLVAANDGEWFDRRTGEPESWRPPAEAMQVHAWAAQWVLEQWHEWAPRTRRSNVEALSRFLPLVVGHGAPSPPPGIRGYLREALRPDGSPDPLDESVRWLGKWGLSLGDLNREVLADVERRLSLGAKGQPLAMSTAGRYRKVAHSCIRRAVELDRLEADPWPPSPKGRNRRKARRKRTAVDVRVLPNPATMVAVIDAIRTHQPGSRIYQVMTAVAYYAGLRPSEVVMLRPRALNLSATGWGSIEVVEADIDWDEAGEPKTDDRTVPIPPRLVDLLRSWVEERGLGDDDLLFRTRNDRRRRTGRGRCTVPAGRSAIPPCGSTTCATPARPPGCGPACRWVRWPGAWGTASRRWCPPTSGRSRATTLPRTSSSTPRCRPPGSGS
jgi:integrase